MACAKCAFYRPKGSSVAQILEAKANLLRLKGRRSRSLKMKSRPSTTACKPWSGCAHSSSTYPRLLGLHHAISALEASGRASTLRRSAAGHWAPQQARQYLSFSIARPAFRANGAFQDGVVTANLLAFWGRAHDEPWLLITDLDDPVDAYSVGENMRKRPLLRGYGPGVLRRSPITLEMRAPSRLLLSGP